MKGNQMEIKAGQIWASKTNSTTVKVEYVLNRKRSVLEVCLTKLNAKGEPVSNRYISKMSLTRGFTLINN